MNKNNLNILGGAINDCEGFNKIISISFEFESTSCIFLIEKDNILYSLNKLHKKNKLAILDDAIITDEYVEFNETKTNKKYQVKKPHLIDNNLDFGRGNRFSSFYTYKNSINTNIELVITEDKSTDKNDDLSTFLRSKGINGNAPLQIEIKGDSDTKNIDLHILNNYNIPNLEFHVTFTQLENITKNIIYDKFKEACTIFNNHFSNFNEQQYYLTNDINNKFEGLIYKNKESPIYYLFLHNYKKFKYYNKTENKLYGDDLLFTPQCTITCKLLDVIDVLKCCFLNTSDQNFFNSILSYLEQSIDISNIICSDNDKQKIKNWIILSLYEYIVLQISVKNNSQYYKDMSRILLKHNLLNIAKELNKTIINFRTQIIVKDNYNFYTIMIINKNDISNHLKSTNILKYKNLSIKAYTTTLEYLNEILYIEIRDFFESINKILNSHGIGKINETFLALDDMRTIFNINSTSIKPIPTSTELPISNQIMQYPTNSPEIIQQPNTKFTHIRNKDNVFLFNEKLIDITLTNILDNIKKKKIIIDEIKKKVIDKNKEFNPKEFNVKKFNEFYDYEKDLRINKNKDVNVLKLQFPKKYLEMEYDKHITDIQKSINKSYSNITDRQDKYESFLKTLDSLPITPPPFEIIDDFLINFNEYIKLDFQISDEDFDDEICLKDNFIVEINTTTESTTKLSQQLNNANYLTFKSKIEEIFDDSFNSLELLEGYNIEKLIITPELQKIINLFNETIPIIRESKISNFYRFDLINCNDVKNYIISQYNFFVDKYDEQILQNNVTKLEERFKSNFVELQSNYLKLSKDSILIYNLELQKQILDDIRQLKSINLQVFLTNYIYYYNKYEEYVRLITQIKIEIEQLKSKLHQTNITINSELEEKHTKYFKQYKINILEKISTDLNININKLIELNNFDEFTNFKLLLTLINIYNSKIPLDKTFNNLRVDLQKYITKLQKYKIDIIPYSIEEFIQILKIDKPQSRHKGGSTFDQHFSKMVDLTLNQTNNLEFKIKFNKLIFYCHALFIYNYKYQRRNIITKINKNEIKKYLSITKYILTLLKQYNDVMRLPQKNIKIYFLKYHYINIKLINNFLIKLNDNWLKRQPRETRCNKDILIFNQTDKINFKLLNVNYNETMKKAIFIFIAFKPILDNFSLHMS
jgi:hypothetical protein